MGRENAREAVGGKAVMLCRMAFQIPESELTFRATRAGGPGGQHVNKASTRVEVVWDVAHSEALSEPERMRVLARLAGRIDGRGRLRVAADDSRSQARNRDAAVERLNALVAQALRVPKPRKKTRPSKATKERRLTEKRRRGAIKRERRRGTEED